jgi:transcriptional regulator with XRE-family HTH domain
MGKLAERIKEARIKREIGVRELATRAGITPGYLSRIEARGEIPTGEVICRLAEALGVPPEQLLDLAKADYINKANADVSQKHKEALRLFRKGK